MTWSEFVGSSNTTPENQDKDMCLIEFFTQYGKVRLKQYFHVQTDCDLCNTQLLACRVRLKSNFTQYSNAYANIIDKEDILAAPGTK